MRPIKSFFHVVPLTLSLDFIHTHQICKNINKKRDSKTNYTLPIQSDAYAISIHMFLLELQRPYSIDRSITTLGRV